MSVQTVENHTVHHNDTPLAEAWSGLEGYKARLVPIELAKFPHVTVETTCMDIPTRQVQLIETDKELILWGTLGPDAWLRQADWADETGAEAITELQIGSIGGGTAYFHTGRPPKAKRKQYLGAHIDFLYHEEYKGYDGMFQVVLEKPIGADSQMQQAWLTEGFKIATGSDLFDAENQEESEAAYKETQYREYYKVEGDLTEEQKTEVGRLTIEITPNGRRHVIDPHMPVDARIAGVRHELFTADSVIGMVLDGELLPVDQRIFTGNFYGGRSSGSDLMDGGSDVVYSYLQRNGSGVGYVRRVPTVFFKKHILQRLDVRAFNNDGYGTRRRENLDKLDSRFGRTPVDTLDGLRESYETRVHPQEYADTLAGKHELCFETSMDSQEVDKIVCPSEPTDGFDDTYWGVVLAPYTRNTGQLTSQVKDIVRDKGEKSGEDFLVFMGMAQSQAEYYLSGITSESMRERLLSKLTILGITQIGGRAIKDVIVEAPKTIQQSTLRKG